jgi:hypothetical protein
MIRCEDLAQWIKPSDLLNSSQFPVTSEDVFVKYSKLALTFAGDRLSDGGWRCKTRVSIESMEERQPIYMGFGDVLMTLRPVSEKFR